MKKKFLSVLLIFYFIIPCIFILRGCNNANNNNPNNEVSVPKFCLLQQGQTLNVGTSSKFTNNQYTTTENYYLEYTKLQLYLCLNHHLVHLIMIHLLIITTDIIIHGLLIMKQKKFLTWNKNNNNN